MSYDFKSFILNPNLDRNYKSTDYKSFTVTKGSKMSE